MLQRRRPVWGVRADRQPLASVQPRGPGEGGSSSRLALRSSSISKHVTYNCLVRETTGSQGLSRYLSSTLQPRFVYCLPLECVFMPCFGPNLGESPCLSSRTSLSCGERAPVGCSVLFGSCFGEHGENPGWGRLPGGKGHGKAEEGSPGALRLLLGITSPL